MMLCVTTLSLLYLSLGGLLNVVAGFGIAPHRRSSFALSTSTLSPWSKTSPPPVRRLSAAAATVIDVEATVTPARTYLLEVAQRLNDEYGVFVIDSKAIDELESAVKDLEATSKPFDNNTYQKDFLGDWTLLVTTATAATSSSSSSSSSPATNFFAKGIDTSRIPFFNEGPSKDIRHAINKQVQVKQVIRSTTNGSYDDTVIDRVDHVLEYQPFNTLQELLKNLVPKELSNVNINPLHVSQGKLTLIHKANVESVTPALKTKLTLQSVVLSVAGTSQYLDPNGKDILGINIPMMSEFLNTGTFETTYMDHDVRVSRGKVGLVEQLRVFVRTQGENVEEDPLSSGENVGDVSVGGAQAETEEAVSDTFFDDGGDLTPSA